MSSSSGKNEMKISAQTTNTDDNESKRKKYSQGMKSMVNQPTVTVAPLIERSKSSEELFMSNLFGT